MLLTHCLLFLSNKVGKLISKDTVVVTAGHKVGFGLLPVMLTGQTNFSMHGHGSFVTGQNNGKL